MKSFLRNLLIACMASFCLSLSVHAAQDSNHHLAEYDRQQTLLVMNQTPYGSEHVAVRQPYTDELWLTGSFLASLTGLFILVRYLRH